MPAHTTLIHTHPEAHLQLRPKRYSSENVSLCLLDFSTDLLYMRNVQSRQFAITKQVEHEIRTRHRSRHSNRTVDPISSALLAAMVQLCS